MQLAAMETLSTDGFLSAERLAANWICPTEAHLPGPLDERVSNANAQDAQLAEFLLVLATEYAVSGPDGLKSRSGLMEHRYDLV